MNPSIPILQLRHKSALIYYEYQQTGPKGQTQFRRNNLREQRKKSYSGNITPGAKKRLTKAITLLVQASKKRIIYNEVLKRKVPHQLTFITLTVSDPKQLLTGKEAYSKLLSHFLAWMRRTKKINTYIWKAELQKNGQIHYHITTPTFINYQEIRDKWNNLQRSAGLLDKYIEAKGHANANSTDVHSVKNIKDLSAYLIKYIAKESQNTEKLGGKIWDCSKNLSATKYFSTPMKEHHELFIKRAQEAELCSIYHAERFSIIKFYQDPDRFILSQEERKNYKAHFLPLFNSISYNDPLELYD